MAKTPSKKSSPAKKPAAKKSTAKKATGQKAAASKSGASRKTAAKKTPPRESSAKKSSAQKSSAKKTPAKKTSSENTAGENTAAAKTATKSGATEQPKSRPKAAATDKQCVFVLGFHRSGTSALMRALHSIGVPLTDKLMPSRPDNPEGFFEDEEVRIWHDHAMEGVGVPWYDVSPFPAGWIDSAPMTKLRAQLTERMQGHFADKTLFGVKDPRLCRLFPVWFRVCEDLGIEPKVVIALRKPLESAMSIYKRNQIAKKNMRMTMPHALVLWLRYITEGEQASRGLMRTVSTYDDLLTEPDACVGRLAETLDLPLEAGNLEAGKKQVRDFVDENKRHQKLSQTGPADQHPPLVQLARQLYLSATRSEKEFQTVSTGLRRRLDAGWALYGPMMRGFDTGQAASLQGKPVVKH